MKYFLIVILCVALNTSCKKAQSAESKVYTPEEAKIISIKSSSVLEDIKNRYKAANICDGTDSSWCAGGKEKSIGEWIEVSFDRKVKISTLFVKNGYGDPKFWEKNNRIKEMKVTSDNGKQAVVVFPDKKDKQSVKMSGSLEGETFTFTIISIYKGSKYPDICLNELAFTESSSGAAVLGKFCGRDFTSFEFDMISLHMTLNSDGSADGSGSAGSQCGKFSSGSWESKNNGKEFTLRYNLTGEGGDTCDAVDEYGSLILLSCPENNQVVFEGTKLYGNIRCDYQYNNGAIVIDNCGDE